MTEPGPNTSEALAARIAGLVNGQPDRHTPSFVALDGPSGVGKSTIARLVAERLVDDSGRSIVTVIDGDDFYSGGSAATWDGRSAQEKVADGMDWRRQHALLEALRSTGEGRYRPFDWWHPDWDADTTPLGDEKTLTATPVVLLEGAYSGRPELADLLDLRILVTAPLELRKARVATRDGSAYSEDWFQRWEAAEALYFGSVHAICPFDLILTVDEPGTWTGDT